MMGIPIEAKLKFKGIIFDTYQWEQKQFDGTVKTFEMVKRKPTVDIICVVDGKIMVLTEEQPNSPVFPCLPGGRVEEGEDPITAAKRELGEETGHNAKEWTLLYEWFGQTKIYFHESLILARSCAKITSQNLDSGERISVTFVDFDNFLALVRKPEFRAPINLKYLMYEALIDNNKRQELKRLIFGKDER
jgi:8-oxo-dGTP pyrophosphatase MutT (NUDIX family)